MKTQTLLLGEYASSHFYIYMIPSSSNNAIPSSSPSTTTSTIDYLSIEDLHQLFFHHPPNDLNPLLFSIYHQYPHHFYYDQSKTCYMAKQHVLDLARSLHLFALAEFCALSHEELLHRVADPLFAITNAVMLRPVTPKRMDIDLDWFPLPSNDDSFFSSLLKSDASHIVNADNAATLFSNSDNVHRTTNIKHHHDFPISFFPILKQNFHSWTHHFLPLQNVGLKCTIRAQKQQQAIIDCRMRLLVYRQALPAAIQQKQQQQQVKKSAPTKSTSPVNTNITSTKASGLSPLVHPHPQHHHYHQHQHQQPHNHHNHHHHHEQEQQRKRKSTPPSPPSIYPPSEKTWSIRSSLPEDYYANHSHQQESNHHHHHHSQHHHHHHLHHPHHHNPHYQQSSTSVDHHKLKRLKSLYSNLDLLATQATKMKGLPLSPEISPPPHPSPSSVLSLPPISTTTTPPTTSTSSFYSSSFIQSISLPSIRNVLSDI